MNKSIIGIEGESSFTNNDNINSHLITLSMNFNNIIYIDKLLIKLPELTNLNMDYNLISKIGNKTFKYNTKLESINLRNNKIITFDFDIVYLPSLQTLQLSDNILTRIDESAFHSITSSNHSKSVYINFICNYFKCNLSLYWINRYKYNNKVNIHIGNSDCKYVDENIPRFKSEIYNDLQKYISVLCLSMNITLYKQG